MGMDVVKVEYRTLPQMFHFMKCLFQFDTGTSFSWDGVLELVFSSKDYLCDS